MVNCRHSAPLVMALTFGAGHRWAALGPLRPLIDMGSIRSTNGAKRGQGRPGDDLGTHEEPGPPPGALRARPLPIGFPRALLTTARGRERPSLET